MLENFSTGRSIHFPGPVRTLEGLRATLQQLGQIMKSKNIVVIGTGHVGLVTAATLAHIGHHVVGLDDDSKKIAMLEVGEVPFFEEGLQALVDDERAAGRLCFSHKPEEAIAGAEV